MARLSKRVAIARSGVYKYRAEEVPGFGLSVPPEKKGQAFFGVFRPPEVLKSAKDKFARLPVTLEHPRAFVDGNNYRDLDMGWTGDSVETESVADSVDVLLLSTLTLADNEAISAYYRGIVEVSPGYKGVFVWDSGVTPSGEIYDIRMKDVTEVNHLALTRKGKGGSATCVFDSREVIVRKRKSGIFYAIYKKLSGVNDSQEDGFISELSDLIKNARKLEDEQVGLRVASLVNRIDPLPDSEDKTKLVSYVEDLVGVKEESDEAAIQASIMIGNLYTELDKQALANVALDSYVEEKPAQSEDSGAPNKKEEAAPSVEEKETGVKPDGKPEKAGEGAPEDNDKKGEEQEGAKNTALDQPSAGPDDAIFDKKFHELTTEEKEFLWSELMCVLKTHSIEEHEQTVAAINPEPPIEDKKAEEKEEDDGSGEEIKDDDKATEEPIKPEEKVEDSEVAKKKKKDDQLAVVLDSATDTQYPDGATIDNTVKLGESGVDLDKLFGKMTKGRKR
jgi:hypothetical protein